MLSTWYIYFFFFLHLFHFGKGRVKQPFSYTLYLPVKSQNRMNIIKFHFTFIKFYYQNFTYLKQCILVFPESDMSWKIYLFNDCSSLPRFIVSHKVAKNFTISSLLMIKF